MTGRLCTLMIVWAIGASVPATAQWLKEPTKGISHTADVPLSDTTLSALGARLQFVPDEKGAVGHLIFHIVEGDIKGVRK